MSHLPPLRSAPPHPATRLAAALLHAHDAAAEASFTEPRTAHPYGIERHAGTYAVLVAPTLTLLVDGGQEGTPCGVSPEGICAVWITDLLLRAFGTTYEALRDGNAQLEDGAIPPPLFDRRVA